MQWRMIARRCPARSMTIVGDLGQTVGAWVTSSWDEVIARLEPRTSHVAELSINYRSPEPVAELAARVLATAAPDLTPPRSVRRDGDPVEVLRLPPADLVVRAIEIAKDAAAGSDGTVAVIASEALVEATKEALGIRPDADPAGLLDAEIAPLTVEQARGLEFDVVIVVEPAAIVATTPGGLRALYVALTRPTRTLVIVHADPLPEAMRRA